MGLNYPSSSRGESRGQSPSRAPGVLLVLRGPALACLVGA